MQIAPLELPLIRLPEHDYSLPEFVLGHVQRFGNAIERLPALNRSIALRPLWETRRLGAGFAGCDHGCDGRDGGQWGGERDSSWHWRWRWYGHGIVLHNRDLSYAH